MERLAQLQSRIASIGELLDIIGAMRSLAAARVQQAHNALDGIRRYADTVSAAVVEASGLPGLSEPGPVAAPEPGRRGLVVFCSEHGFAGPFNDQMLDRAEAEPAEAGRLCVVGGRGALLAEERGLEVAWTQPMASHIGGVLETARRLADALYDRIGRGEIVGVDLLFARYRSGGHSEIDKVRVLPPDPARFARARTPAPPLHDLPAEDLLERLIGEYVLAELARAAMESFASENGARLRAMESAHENIEDKLEELHRSEHRLRQEEITMELLDVVTGARALLDAGA